MRDLHAHGHCSITHNSQDMETSEVSRKKEILMFATTWMDLEDMMLSKMSDREGQVLHDIIYMWNLLINKR